MKPGTTIITDSWKGYNDVKKYFKHLVINHSKNFVDPKNKEIHTQKIERFWRTLKSFLKNNTAHNYKLKNIMNCLYEQMHKNIHDLKKFSLFVKYLNYFTKSNYDLNNLLN